VEGLSAFLSIDLVDTHYKPKRRIKLTTDKEEFVFLIHMFIIKTPIFHMPLEKILYAGIQLKVKNKHTLLIQGERC
jgi:hypothetical protein